MPTCLKDSWISPASITPVKQYKKYNGQLQYANLLQLNPWKLDIACSHNLLILILTEAIWFWLVYNYTPLITPLCQLYPFHNPALSQEIRKTITNHLDDLKDVEVV